MGQGSHSSAARNQQELGLVSTFQSNYLTKKASLPQRHREMGQNENSKSELSDLKKKSPRGVLSLVPKKAGSQGFRIIQRVVREAGRYGEFSTK